MNASIEATAPELEPAPQGLSGEVLPHTPISRVLDGLIRHIGEFSAWLWPVLMLVIIVNVVSRYVFSQGFIELEELQWHIYSAGFLIALSYALLRDNHVRVDLFRERFSFRTQAWIELGGMLLLLGPFIGLLLYYSVPYVIDSWHMNEASSAPGGLGHRWIIKSALPLGLGLVLLAAFSRFTRLVAFLAGSEVRHAD
ncbi:TRAP transporter small permease subunit [Marinobacter sp. R17]|uniref:TRAP transporter small permease subunit n=1 Tax=Marinobacter sp. R17 TaxID=2484250 RepID=UPI000F4CF04E|nr:TRAP transporter small permease subunit [Marinobacter sp. R17]ROT99676.1 TRAP transporter small permease subunit [Marinobacter sp. R17]